MKRLKVGDIFKDDEDDYCKITSISGTLIMINYSRNLKTILEGKYDSEGAIEFSTIERMKQEGTFQLIPQKITNWRERIE